MPRRLSEEDEVEILRVYDATGSKRAVMRDTGFSWDAIHRVVEAQKVGSIKEDLANAAKKIHEATIGKVSAHADTFDETIFLESLRKIPMTLGEIAAIRATDEAEAGAYIHQLRDRGLLIIRKGSAFQWIRQAPQGNAAGRTLEYVSRPDNTYVFGACGDQHIGSKYFRQDVLDDLYDEFAKAGVDRVFNTGNWIDGEAPFNMFDLEVHGLDPQINRLVECYPTGHEFETYAISGNDHEGWYNKKLGIDVGLHAERAFRIANRSDWHHIGFMQANAKLVNASTGKSCILTVMHPGGGSAYAHSYKPQKIVEGFSGGDKPGVLLIGHYHKLSLNMIRNVWTVQTGCSQDQTPFMMQKLIEPHVGGVILKVEQDPETGAIIRCVADFRNYFVRSYYNDRWSMSGSVKHPRRSTA